MNADSENNKNEVKYSTDGINLTKLIVEFDNDIECNTAFTDVIRGHNHPSSNKHYNYKMYVTVGQEVFMIENASERAAMLVYM